MLFFLQFSFFASVGIGLNLMLAFVLVLAQKRFNFSGIIWIAVAGFLLEVFSVGIPGLNVLAVGLLAFCYQAVNSFFVAFENNKLLNGVVYAAGLFLFDLILYYVHFFISSVNLFEVNFSMMADFLSLNYLFKIIFFVIASYAVLGVYEKMEKISGEKDHGLIIKNN